MSNLAHGNVRLKGKRKDICLFLENELWAWKEEFVFKDTYSCEHNREERQIKVIPSKNGYYLSLSRDKDTNRGFYFRADAYGQFIHAFDSNLSFKAPWAKGGTDPDETDILYLDSFAARYESIDIEWFSNKASQYGISVRIYLTDFESGLPSDAIYRYTSTPDKPFEEELIGKEDIFWECPDRKQLRMFEYRKED